MTDTNTEPMPHSPLPWHVEDIGAGSVACGVIDADGGMVVMHDFVSLPDAAFIARACNSHDELLAMLREFLSSYDANTRAICGPAMLDRLARAEVVIQKAEGR